MSNTIALLTCSVLGSFCYLLKYKTFFCFQKVPESVTDFKLDSIDGGPSGPKRGDLSGAKLEPTPLSVAGALSFGQGR